MHPLASHHSSSGIRLHVPSVRICFDPRLEQLVFIVEGLRIVAPNPRAGETRGRIGILFVVLATRPPSCRWVV